MTITAPPQFGISAGVPAASLLFDTTVSRRLVRRASIADVLVTDSMPTGDDTFAVAAQLRPGHQFGENDRAYDFLLLDELFRQSALLIGYRHYRASPDMQTAIMRSMRLDIVNFAAVQVGSTPSEVVLMVAAHPKRNTAGRLQSLAFTTSVYLDGRRALEGEGQLFLLPTSTYQRMRERGKAAKVASVGAAPERVPANAATVGRQRASSVVVTEPTRDGIGRASAALVVRPSHPCMFAQLVDHIPGGLQIEGARQLAVAEIASRLDVAPDELTVSAVGAEFVDYAELGLDTRVRVEIGDLNARAVDVGSARVRVSQGDAVVARAELVVARA